MVQSCSAYNCTERYKRGTDISFHLFPRDSLLKKQWIIAMRRENFNPSQYSRICSKHFTDDSFITNKWSSIKKLKNDAVPSIFNFPSHLTNKITTRKPPPSGNVKVENEDNTVTSINEGSSQESVVEPPIKRKIIYCVGDFKERNSSMRHRQYRLAVKRILIKKQRQIKILQQRNRHLSRIITNLKSSLEHLKQERMIDENSSLKVSSCSVRKYTFKLFDMGNKKNKCTRLSRRSRCRAMRKRIKKLAGQLQHDNLQKHLDLESRNIFSNDIAKIKIKAEPEEDKQNKNTFEDRGQFRSMLERSEIKIETVDHDIKEEVLEDSFINSTPKLNTDNASVAINNFNLLSEDCRPFDATSNETPTVDTEWNENHITTEFVKCEGVHDADNYYYE